jgi:hypothetical protein
MNLFENLSAQQLRRAAEIKDLIESLEAELVAIMGGEIPVPFAKAKAVASEKETRGGMSAAGRARIAAAAKARWAKIRKSKGSAPTTAPKKAKRTFSPEVRAKIAAAAKARWAKAKEAGKTAL